MISLIDFIQKEENLPCDLQDISSLLVAVQQGCVEINDQVVRAGLLNILGKAGEENVQGEEQQKLDVFADDVLINAFRATGIVSAIASEENEDIVIFNDNPDGKYIVSFDPLDGSSNIDVNVSIGTIFSVYERKSINVEISEIDFLRSGRDQLMAGYVIYGSSTMLVLTTGNGVNFFTLDPDQGVFILSQSNVITPESGKIYSINEGNSNSFSNGLQAYISLCKSKQNDTGASMSARYIGSMVADVHRNLIKGGVFIYPDSKTQPNGKLRVLYECHPMSFIVEQAGGLAHTGKEHILDLETNKLHQRCPVYMGSKNMVQDVLTMIANKEIA